MWARDRPHTQKKDDSVTKISLDTKMKTIAKNFFTDKIIHRLELWLFLAVICIINIPMLFGHQFYNYIFSPAEVGAGEWWRVITYPFIHVSWYHLLLDVGAFMLLYHGILEPSWLKRVLYVVFCAIGSLGISMLSPEIFDGGLCGLSGIAHGLMAVSALEIATSSADIKLQRIGIIGLWVVVIKSIIEVLTGKVMFAFLHLGDVGTPLTICHAGGVLTGIIAFVVLRQSDFITRLCRA